MIIHEESLITIFYIMKLFSYVVSLFRQSSNYQSLNKMTINKANLIHNFDLFHRHKPHYTIIPVLKSNAYGHGLKQVAGIVDGIPHCDILAVDSYPEYQIIYKYTDKTILLMGETKLENYRLFDYQRTHLAVRNMATVVELAAL